MTISIYYIPMYQNYVFYIQVGVEGESLQLYTEEGSKKVKWNPASGPGTPITWYKVTISITVVVVINLYLYI